MPWRGAGVVNMRHVHGHMMYGGGGCGHEGRHSRNRVARGYVEALFQQRARCPTISARHEPAAGTLGDLLDADMAVVRPTLAARGRGEVLVQEQQRNATAQTPAFQFRAKLEKTQMALLAGNRRRQLVGPRTHVARAVLGHDNEGGHRRQQPHRNVVQPRDVVGLSVAPPLHVVGPRPHLRFDLGGDRGRWDAVDRRRRRRVTHLPAVHVAPRLQLPALRREVPIHARRRPVTNAQAAVGMQQVHGEERVGARINGTHAQGVALRWRGLLRDGLIPRRMGPTPLDLDVLRVGRNATPIQVGPTGHKPRDIGGRQWVPLVVVGLGLAVEMLLHGLAAGVLEKRMGLR